MLIGVVVAVFLFLLAGVFAVEGPEAYAFSRWVEAKWPEWELLSASVAVEKAVATTAEAPTESIAPPAVVSATDAAARAELAAKITNLKAVQEPPKAAGKKTEAKVARCLYAGMLALAASAAARAG